MKLATSLLTAAALASWCGAVSAQTVITDDFEVDSSADYTVVTSNNDGTITFAFDYIAAGIPLAPNSTAGDSGGLRITANDTLGASDATTAFNNTPIGDVNYLKLTVDVYMNVGGTGGTTEYGHIGLAGDGVSPNTVFTPISGSGTFVAFTGEGGSGGSDYRYFIEGQTTTTTGDPSYLAGSGANTAQLYQDIFPNTDGSPENIWTTLEIVWSGGNVVYSFDGVPIIDTSLIDPGLVDNQLTSIAGLASLGYADVFSSVAAPFQSQFVVFDNLVVEVPEPATAMLLGLGALGLIGARRRS